MKMAAASSDSSELILFVNGKRITLSNPEQDKTLLQFLREDLGLAGTKLGCGEGTCGACTVAVAKQGSSGIRHSAINACYTKLCSLNGASITTAEGLAKDKNTLHPVQERLHLNHGVQCGFCTSGMVMSMHARLLEAEKSPLVDVEDVIKCLDGNLCRCTGYRPIVQAFQTFCQEDGDSSMTTCQRSSFRPYCPDEDDPKLPEGFNDSRRDECLKFVDEKTNKIWYIPSQLSQLSEIQKSHSTFRRFMGGTGSYKRPNDHGLTCDVTVQLNHIYELQLFEETPNAWNFGSALTLTEMLNIFKDLHKGNEHGNVAALCQLYIKALESVGSTQLRNVATVGGSVFYTHPCSDLLPAHFVSGARIELTNGDLVKIDETFCETMADGIQTGNEVVIKLTIPKPEPEGRIVTDYFRKAKRKTFDLAILNAAYLARVSGDSIESIKIAFGGTDQVLQYDPALKGPKFADKTMSALTGMTLSDEVISSDALRDAILLDVGVTAGAPGNFGALRKCLAVTFTQDFLTSIFNKSIEKGSSPHTQFCQIFRQVDSDQPSTDLVERPVPHISAEEMVRGSGVFTDDLTPLKNELIAVLIRSTEAHAEIVSLDFTEALKMDGVVDVVSASDLTADQNRWTLLDGFYEEVFASKEVLHHGQVLAALLCTDRKAGEEAAKKVVVEYKNLPFIVGLREERRKGTDLETLEPLFPDMKFERFQDESLKSGPNIRRITGSVALGRQEHAYMEPHTAVVIPVGEKDEYICYYTTQEPGTVHKNLSMVLGVPQHKIVVKTKRTGGGFGGKERLLVSVVAAAGAKKSGRPVRCVLSRTEDMEITGHRHELVVDYEIDFQTDTGLIVNSSFKAYANGGHSLDLSLAWIMILLFRLDGGYTLKNFSGKSRAIRTNAPSNTAMRGFGGPEGAVVIEEILNRIAYEINGDAADVRFANMTREGDILQHGVEIKGCNLERCWSECIERSQYHEKRKSVEEFNLANRRKKRGLAIMPMKFAPSFFAPFLCQATAYIRIYVDGTVLVSHGGVEMGQGLHTKMIQVASRMLKIDASKIHISESSTETIPNPIPTGGSVGSDMNGYAVIKACEALNERLEPYKKQDPEGTWESWISKAFFDKVNLSAVGFYNTSAVDINFFTNPYGVSYDYLVYGAGCVEIEVDCATGDVSVISADLVMDVGRSLNPAIDIGQIEGAFLQIFGYITSEQLIVSASDGKLLTNNFGTYKIPTASDMPRLLSVTLLDHAGEVKPASSVFSSKAIGEPPTLFSGAIVSAIRQAITSYRKDQGLTDWFDMSCPLTPDKIRILAQDELLDQAIQSISIQPEHQEKWAFEV